MMTLKTDLLPHQRDAVNKMIPSRVGALFMEMGTGKTRTAIELVNVKLHRIDHVVWFCPVSLKETIRREILKHTDATDADIHVFGEKTSVENLPLVPWYVVGIESMSASNRVVVAVNALVTEKSFVIVDESSYIKGHTSKRAERITFISSRARYRLILTGTPLSQGVVDLYAQMRFLSSKILGYNSFYSFAANHLEYSEKFPGMIVRAHNVKYLAAKIEPYVYQITKDECLDLPDKLYSSKWFCMTGEQREAYDEAKDELLSELEKDEAWEIDSCTIFRLFTALQQIVSGFWNQRITHADEKTKKKTYTHIFRTFENGRIPLLMETVLSIPQNEKIIIWAKYNYDVRKIQEAIETQFGPGSVAPFHGTLSIKDREKSLELFRASSRFFLSTQSCGGHGLTLNEASYVIFYTNGFKYSERLQAEDRCHRIGQTRKVNYIDITCSSSIDERINDSLSRKGDVVADFKNQINGVKRASLKEIIKKI